MSTTLAKQIAVIDTQLPDYQVLEQAARAAGLEVLLLSGQGDGVAELAAALAGRSGIAALHILSHGSSGQIQLGDRALNSATLDAYAAELAVIRQALTDDGDLLLYGCGTAADEQGQTFISRLAKIVQADVAGSDDLTGAAARGGDWDLELTEGKVETTTLAVVNYGYTLAAPTFTLKTTPGGSSVFPGLGLKYNSIDATASYIDIVNGDFDSDGDVDLVGMAHNAGTDKSSVYLYINDGSQTFTKNATPILANLDYAAQVIAGDIDGDGDLDVIVADATNASGTGKLSVLKNNGSATFTETTIGTNLTPLWMEIADLDGDGRKDIVFTTGSNPSGKLNWAQQNVDGSFTHTVIGDNGGRNSIVVTDFDGDTDKDIVTTDEGADKVYLWTNNGAQSFARTDLATGFDGSRSVSMGDIDGDGDTDVVVSSTVDDRIRWLENNGSGSFTIYTITTTIDYPLEQHLYDYDGDGDLDIAAAAVFADKFYYLENDGKGNFTQSEFIQTLDGPRHLKAVDLDGDGDKDVLVTADGSGAGWFETGVIVRGVENSSIVFSDAEDRLLGVADTDGGNLTATLSVGAGKGTITVTTGGGATITNDGTNSVTIAGTVAQVNAALATVTYTPPANQSGIAYTALTYSVNDGMTTVTKSLNLDIAAGSKAPTISIDNATLTYTENFSAAQIDSAATATDPDASNNWNGGKLEIQITGNGESADRLTIPDNVVGTINTNGTEIRNNTTVIGSLSASEGTVTGTTKLTITFNANMTDALVQSLVRAIYYDNTSDAPGTGARIIRFSLRDKDGYTVADSRTINITAANDNPAIASMPASITVIEDAASNVDLSAATLSDPDSASGSITLTITAGAGTLAASTGGSVTVSNSGTSALTLSGTATNIDTFLNTDSNIQYTGASNVSGNNATTLTLTANDGGNMGSGGGTDVSLGSVAVNITGVADTPSVTNAATSNVTQTSSGLVLSRNAADGTEVTHFKITGITNGNLFKSDGTTAITNGTFITFDEGNAGLKFTPTGGGNGSFTAQASTSNVDGGLGGSTVNASITVATATLTSATYDASTGILVVTGAAMEANGGGADIAVNKLTLTGEGGETYLLTSGDVEITSATEFSVTLNTTDQAALSQILNKNGTASTSGTDFNLAAADDWNTNVTTGDTADATNAVTVSNVAVPAITSAAYNATTGVLSVTGTGFLKRDGATNDIVANKFTITGEAGGTYTLTDSADVEISSGTAFTLTLSATDKTAVNALVNKAGTSSNDNTTYNLAAADDWAAGAAAAVNVADLAGSGITATLSDGGGGGGGGTPPPPAPPPAGVPTGTFDGVTLTATTATSSSGATVTTVSIPVVTGTRQDDPNTVRNTHADIPIAQNSSGETVLQVSVPTGVGLTSQTITGTGTSGTLTLRETLIAASGPRVENTLAFAEILQQGIDTYVPGVQDQSQVTVRTLTLSAPTGSTGASTATVIITGASGTGESDTNNPLRQEALVIDARALPSGTTLQLDNVEFAIIIGASRVLGGSGRNFAVGDDAAQFFVLGEDDDVLRGGGGNDTVGSKGGNDTLYGDAGNDRLVGGIGDDELYGGDGDDILQGGASDAGSWAFALNSQGQMVARFTPAESELADMSGATFSGAWTRAAHERGQDDSRIGLVEQDYRTLEDIALLFNALTGQLPGAATSNAIANAYPSAHGLAQAAYDYFAAHLLPSLTQTHTVEAHMRALITRVWGSADDDMVAVGSQYIHGGGNWADGLLYLARHANNRNDLIDADGTLRLTSVMTVEETGWLEAVGNDALYGGEGNDWLVGGNGDNRLDGGEGIDMAGLVGTLADYTLRQQLSDGVVEIVLTRVQGGNTHSLRNVELLKVGNEIYAALNVLPSGTVAVAADRPLADFVRLVGTAELQALGVPEGWMG